MQLFASCFVSGFCTLAECLCVTLFTGVDGPYKGREQLSLHLLNYEKALSVLHTTLDQVQLQAPSLPLAQDLHMATKTNKPENAPDEVVLALSLGKLGRPPPRQAI